MKHLKTFEHFDHPDAFEHGMDSSKIEKIIRAAETKGLIDLADQFEYLKTQVDDFETFMRAALKEIVNVLGYDIESAAQLLNELENYDIDRVEDDDNSIADDLSESVSAENILKQILKKNKRFKWLNDDLPKNFSKQELKDALTKAGYGKEYGLALKDLKVNESKYNEPQNDIDDAFKLLADYLKEHDIDWKKVERKYGAHAKTSFNEMKPPSMVGKQIVKLEKKFNKSHDKVIQKSKK